MTRCPNEHEVDRHFEGRGGVEHELALRQHLLDCEQCRARHRRWSLYERLALPSNARSVRLSKALGFSPPEPPRFAMRRQVWASALVLTVAVAAAVLTLGRAPDEPPRPRGAQATSPSLVVHAIDASGPRRVQRDFRSGDELAFTYLNLSHRRFLLLYAVDEHAHVYWFAPTWRSQDENPTAVAIAADDAPHELGLATRHTWDAQSIALHAVFTDEAVAVKEVERRLASGAAAASGEDVTLALQVTP
jgi:hypothetical protein